MPAYTSFQKKAVVDGCVYYQSANVIFSAALAANSTIFFISPSITNRDVRILGYKLISSFSGTNAASTQIYNVVKRTGASGVSGGTSLTTPAKMHSVEPASVMSIIRVSDGATAITPTGGNQFFGGGALPGPRQNATTTLMEWYSVIAHDPKILFGLQTAASILEAFEIQSQLLGVVGDTLSITVWWEEGIAAQRT